jgi:hypothetical protein
MAILLSQSHYRFGKDDGTESTHTWYANEDAPASLPLDTNLLLRICVQESGGTAAPNLVQQFQYSVNNLSGPWTNVTTVLNTPVRAVAVAAFTNGQNCTKRLSGTGTFESSAAGCTEDGNSGGGSNDVVALGCTETELGFRLDSTQIAQGSVVYFRLTVSGPTTSITYSVTPTGHVAITEAPALAPVVLAGQAPSRVVNYIAAVAVGALSMAGVQPTATVEVPNITCAPTVGALAMAGHTPQIPTLTVELREGTTLRATRYLNLTGSLATTDIDLTTDERNAIVNWTDLRVSLIASGGQVEVTWADLKAPTATGADAIKSPPLGAMALAGVAPTPFITAPDIAAAPPVGSLAFAGPAPTLLSFTVKLWSGTTLIATRAIVLTDALATYSLDLTTEERTAVADWATLSVSFIADGKQAEVTWLDMKAPASVTAQTVSPATGTLSLAGPVPIVYGSAPLTASPATGALELVGTVPPRTTVQLWMGPSSTGTKIAEWEVALTSSFATLEWALTDAQFAAITAWGDLHVVVIADGNQTFVSWVELQTPERGASPGAGTLTLTGVAPLPGPLRAGTPAPIAVAGYAPTLNRDYVVRPSSGALGLAGTRPEVVAEVRPGRGALTLAGLAPSVSRGLPNPIVPTLVGSLALSGLAPTVTQQLGEAPGAGTLVLAGLVPTTSRQYVATPAAGTLSLAGRSPLPSVSSTEAIVRAPESAALTLAGVVPTVVQAAIGPVAISWGPEALASSHLSSDMLVSAELTGDTLEYVT